MSQYTMSIQAVWPVLQYLKQQGHSPADALSQWGISPTVLAKPATRFSHAKLTGFTGFCATIANDPFFGLHTAESVNADSFELYSHLISVSRNLKEALEKTIQYLGILEQGNAYRFAVENDTACFFVENLTGLGPERHIDEFMVAAPFLYFQQKISGDFRLKRVLFEHEAPEDISEHERIFNAPILFNHHRAGFCFDVGFLESPFKTSNAVLSTLLTRMANERMSDIPDASNWSVTVEKEIWDAMQTSDSLDLDAISTRLGVSTRTLQRRLTDCDTTYKTLLDKVRKSMALKLLRRPSLSIADITYLLGFSDQAAFTRAFKRWEGMSPRQFRISNEK
ncbi:MAG: AraC family transcriptional regulator [Deltaproteobacteria bacterium]|nr:AraC family transcriptional regulator [Deltaproteobacteria bacterium]